MIDRLLKESEGTTLDFKRDQYKFDGASDEEKAKLLKDILSFANTIRSTDAHIIIGVECNGGTKTVVGITEHLDDAKLQEFVNSKTNKYIVFSYETILYESSILGVLRIPAQEGPFYLKKRFSSINQEQLWRRQGSSNTLAKLEYAFEIGREYRNRSSVPSLSIDTCYPKNGTSLSDLTIVRTAYRLGEYPDYVSPKSANPFGIMAPIIRNPNSDYWRELAQFVWAHSLAVELTWRASNVGEVAAEDVVICVLSEDNPGLRLLDDLPDEPMPYFDHARHLENVVSRIGPSDSSVVTTGQSWRAEVEIGMLSPGRSIVSTSPLYLLSDASGEGVIHARVTAKNLPKPILVQNRYNISFTNADLDINTLYELTSSEDEYDYNDELA